MRPVSPRTLGVALTREKCRRSFHYFLREFWPVISNEPLVDAPHIAVLCSEVEKMVRRLVARKPKEYDLIVNVPPGTSKSSIFSEALEAWAWILDPSLQFITLSHSLSLSLSLAVKSRDIILSEKYRECFPEVRIRADIKGKQWFMSTEGGYRYCCTPLISPIGRHAHLIVVDDPVDPVQAESTVSRNAANSWFESTMPARVVDKALVPYILVMQRLHEDDPTGFLLKNSASPIRHIKLPGMIDSRLRPVPEELERIYTDGVLDPVRLGRKEMDSLRLRMGMYSYAGQMEQEPVPAEGGLFLPEKMSVVPVVPGRLKQVVRSWDKAGTEGGGCNSSGVKMGELDDGRFIVLDVIKGQWRAERREAIMLQTARLDGKKVKIVIEQEGGSGGKESAEATIRNMRGFDVRADHPVGSKALRADPLAAQVNVGNVLLLEGGWNRDYLDELRSFPRGRFKDQVDASSQAFAALTRKNAIDYKKMMRKRDMSVNGILLPETRG